MSQSDVLVNIRRALIPLAAVRALEPRLLPAIVLHVSLQCLLVSVAGITSGTVIRHLSGLPKGSVFALDHVLATTVIHAQDVHNTSVVGLQESSYEQEEGEIRLVWIKNTGRTCDVTVVRTKKNVTGDTIKGRRMSKRCKWRDISKSRLCHHNRRDAWGRRSSRVECGSSRTWIK